MKSILCCVLLALTILPQAYSRTFSTCEVAEIMEAAGFARESLPDWMCLILNESSFNSSSIGGPNTNGSFDWGLFQINDNYWCNAEFAGLSNDCNMECTGKSCKDFVMF